MISEGFRFTDPIVYIFHAKKYKHKYVLTRQSYFNFFNLNVSIRKLISK